MHFVSQIILLVFEIYLYTQDAVLFVYLLLALIYAQNNNKLG